MNSESDDDLSDSDDSSTSSFASHYEERWYISLQRIRENDPLAKELQAWGTRDYVFNMTDEEWEELGRDISNNTHLNEVNLSLGALNDHKMSCLFRGLTRSSSMERLDLKRNELSVAGIRSMVPFLQHANNLQMLTLDNINNLQSEGFNFLLRALSNSPIEKLCVNYCNIESIEVGNIPRNLKLLCLSNNSINADGCRQLAKLLQITNSLTCLRLNGNGIQSAGFNILFRALRDSPIKGLRCNACGIGSIEIDDECIPRNLTMLSLAENNIDVDGCQELAKLLQGGDATISELSLSQNKIDDEGVAVLVDSLRSNTSLRELYLEGNNGMSSRANIMLLKLVNDISSIKATLQSNHTLRILQSNLTLRHLDERILGQNQRLINIAININSNAGSPEAAGKEKVIQTQLNSVRRAQLAEMQGVNQSLYSEINPLHLPEVLSLVGHHHGQEEFFIALKSSIAGVISTVNRKECILQRRGYLLAEVAQLDAELAAIEAAEGVQGDVDGRNKRLRVC